jgi:hypothetical protein
MKKKLIITASLLFLMSLVPCAKRTWKWASDAHGLVILATLDPEEITFNPYSINGYFIGQEMAIWLLKEFDYPYEACSKTSELLVICGSSLVGRVGRTLDMGSDVSIERGYQLLNYFIIRGEDVNELTEGIAPIHEAILYRNARYLKTLLAAGANLEVRIIRPEKEYDGFDAFKYLELLESKQKADFSEIREIINQYQNQKK